MKPTLPQNVTVLIVHSGEFARVPRTIRTFNALTSNGYQAKYLGWLRAMEDWPTGASQEDCRIEHIRHRGEYGLRSIFGLPSFLFAIARAILRDRPRVIHAANEEIAFWCVPFAWLTRASLICDVYDSLPDRIVSKSTFVHTVAKWIASVVYKNASAVIVADNSRIERLTVLPKTLVAILNTPIEVEDVPAALPTGPVKVFASGNLHLGRGIRQLVEAAHQAGDTEIHAAGMLGDEFAKTVFSADPTVVYHGVLPHSEAMQLAAECDATFAYYVPQSLNNIYASPSKVFEAMCVGRRNIMNSETRLSAWITERDLGYSAPYGDVSALSEIFHLLGNERKSIAMSAKHIRSVYLDECSWLQMEKRLLKLYQDLTCNGNPVSGA